MTTYEPGSQKSPDRLDALVWALTELMVGYEYPMTFYPPIVGPSKASYAAEYRWASSPIRCERSAGHYFDGGGGPPGGWPMGVATGRTGIDAQFRAGQLTERIRGDSK